MNSVLLSLKKKFSSCYENFSVSMGAKVLRSRLTEAFISTNVVTFNCIYLLHEL